MTYWKNGAMSRKAVLGVVLAAIAALAATGSQASDRHDPPMRLGAAAPAPYGFMDFCRRQPAECGVTAVMLAKASQIGAAQSTAADTAAGAAGADTLNVAPEASVGATVARVSGSQAELLKLITKVNRNVNREISFEPDLTQYGVQEFWAVPSETGTRYGDCEDYVLEKRHALLALGFAPSSLSIAVVTTRWGASHALLLVAIDDQEYVLDSLTPWVVRVSEAPYDWQERQVQGQALVWAKIRQPADDLGTIQLASSLEFTTLRATPR